ncbi:hypothetical protein [Candidatus Nitrospira bockiana]
MIPDSLTIGGEERVDLLQASTLEITDELNARNICRLTLIDTRGWYRPAIGQTLVVRHMGETIFAGTIDRLKESRAAGTNALTLELDAVDYNQIADRHLVAEVYDDQTMKQIVQDIVTEHLAADGVSLAPDFPDGPTIEHLPFNYLDAGRCFNELSEITGYFWNIGYDKVLRFIDRTTMQAPHELITDNGVALADSVSVERSRDRYRNDQVVRGGQAVTESVVVEELHGDGKQTTFTVALPIAEQPVIKVNGVAKTVGIREVDATFDWYWQEGDEQLSQDTGGTRLTASDTLRVEYIGYTPLVTAAQDRDAIAERISVEGGSGIYQAIEDNEEITRLNLGNDKAIGLLKRFGAIEAKLTFATRKTGFAAGQLLRVYVPEHGLDGEYLISSVRFRERDLTEFHYEITAVEGDAVEGWVAFFSKLMQAGRKHVIRPNEVVNLLRAFREPLTVSEAASTVTGTADPAKVGDKLWSGLVGAG